MDIDFYLKAQEQKHLTRKELYDLVWSMPMRDLARKFDLSDNGLAKKCKRHKIPKPPQGYWLKKENDRKALVKPLPQNNDPYLETIDFPVKTESFKQSLKAKSDLSDDELALALEFKIPDAVQRYHPLIAKCRKKAKKPLIDKYARIRFEQNMPNPGFLVTPKTFDRACLFLQGLIDLFGSYGWSFTTSVRRQYAFKYKDQELTFEIKEPVKKVPNPDQRIRKGFEALNWASDIYVSTGKLEFRITNTHATGYKKTWYDTDAHRIEDQLYSMAQGFSRGFEDRRLWAIEQAEWQKKREKEEAQRKELARIKRLEEDRRKHLFDLAEQYHKAKSVRDLLVALSAQSGNPDGMEDWLRWANAVVDEIDPLRNQREILDKHHALDVKQDGFTKW